MSNGRILVILAWLTLGWAIALADDKIHHERCPGDPEMNRADFAALTLAGPLVLSGGLVAFLFVGPTRAPPCNAESKP